MTPSDTEYLFRAIKTDVSSIVSRLDRLILDGGPETGMLTQAHNTLMEVVTKIGVAKRKWDKRVMDHRYEPGEYR